MLIVVSPAKSLDFESPARTKKFTEPSFLKESKQLVSELKKLNPDDIAELMNVSSKLAEENYARYANWKTPFTPDNAKQAIFAFKGDVYLGLKAEEFSTADLNFAQKHLRILSGLYGILRPLDLMQAYRLEMGRKFGAKGAKTLYEFWGTKLTDALKEELESQAKKSRVLINLASNEYFNSLQAKDLGVEIISPVFKDYSNGSYKILSFFAKKARGEMAAYIIRNRIDTPEKIRDFDIDGYKYSENDSTANKPVFLRRQK